MNKIHSTKRVSVLRGGPSEEYNISMNTGSGVLSALEDTDYIVEDIIITRSGEWLKNGIVRAPADALSATDVVFIALHGAYGEDGTVQRILERLNISYTNNGPFSSALAMNKMLTKEHLKKLGVQMAPHMRITRESSNNIPRIVNTIMELFGPEYVVKPISGGSSINIQMANSASTLVKAIETVLETHDDILVEKRIRGREATCGVVENFRSERIYKLPTIEIIQPTNTDFFDTEIKYSDYTDEVEICPSNFKSTLKKRLEESAKFIHETLGLSQYSRSDFMVLDDDIYFLEVNTLPGMTKDSLVPKSLAAVGCTYADFINHLLTDATTQSR